MTVFKLLTRFGDELDTCHADSDQQAADYFADEWDLDDLEIVEADHG